MTGIKNDIEKFRKELETGTIEKAVDDFFSIARSEEEEEMACEVYAEISEGKVPHRGRLV